MTRWLKVQQPTRVANKRLVNLPGAQRPEDLARPGCFARPNYFADVAIVVDAMAMMISVASMTTYVTFNFRNSTKWPMKYKRLLFFAGLRYRTLS